MIHLHLLSLPWSTSTVPSAATGRLHAFVEKKYSKNQVQTFQHSAHMAIPVLLYDNYAEMPFDIETRQSAEGYFFLIYLRRYLIEQFDLPKDAFDISFKQYNKYLTKRGLLELTIEDLNNLEKILEQYVDDELDLKNSDPDIHKVYGFTVNFAQTYASLLTHRIILEKRPDSKNTSFIYGGAATTSLTAVRLFKKLNVQATFAKGDGEGPLEKFLDLLISKQNVSNEQIEIKPEKTLTSLTPNYDKYFLEHQDYLKKRPVPLQANTSASIPMEGSRGCYYKCTFCSFSAAKEIYRTKTSESVFNEFQDLKSKYFDKEDVFRFRFQDNLCDDWALGFAQRLIEVKNEAPYIMMLRANHPFSFWETLKKSGLYLTCIGIENFSGPLLNKIIKKGSPVVHNIMVMKYMKELNIICNSNVITHFPGSTLEDVEENRRIYKKISHLDELSFFPFKLYSDSPLYKDLPFEIQTTIKTIDYFELPYDLNSFSAEPELALPEVYQLPVEVDNAWNKFIRWSKTLNLMTRNEKLSCETMKHKTVIRHNGKEYSVLTGIKKEIFDICHVNHPIQKLEKALPNYTREELEQALDELCNTRAMVKSGNQFISIALRKEITDVYYKDEYKEELSLNFS